MKISLPFGTAAAISLALIMAGCTQSKEDQGKANSCSVLDLRVSNGDNCSVTNSPVVPILMLNADGTGASCTGTMISLTSILTAGHCSGVEFDDLLVLTPAGNFSVSEGTVTKIAVHPGYTGGVAPYDVAIIQVASSVNVPPVALLTSEPISSGERVTVFGYGLDENGQSLVDRLQDGDRDRLLKAGEMQITEVFADLPIFAAQFDLTQQSACPGDSGGPVLQKFNKQPAIVGIVSFGSAETCTEGSFAGFVNVQDPSVMSFIRAHVPDLSNL